MRQINIKSEIHSFDTFKDFAKEFNVGKKDLIFTRKAFLPYFNKLEEEPIFLFNDGYGKGEPTDIVIDNIIADVNKLDFDRVIAIGGGSVVDIAKLLVLKNVTSVQALFEKKIPAVKDKKLIIIPTTCGTGSEVTNISITAVESLHTKLGLADDALFADYAILIPELLDDLPFNVIVNSSVDALVHAAESFLSPKATPFSSMYSKEAMKIIVGAYCHIIKNGKDHVGKYIKDLLLASTYAGLAFGQAGTAVVHAMAYPLGSSYNVAHGEANYQFFMPCFKHYMEKMPEGKISQIAQIFGSLLGTDEKSAFDCLQNVLDKLLPLKSLREYGMKEDECTLFADSVLKNQQRLLVNSYFQFTLEEIESIYKERY